MNFTDARVRMMLERTTGNEWPRYSTLLPEIIGVPSLEITRVQHGTQWGKRMAQTEVPEQWRLLLSLNSGGKVAILFNSQNVYCSP